jgi:plastocyanin
MRIIKLKFRLDNYLNNQRTVFKRSTLKLFTIALVLSFMFMIAPAVAQTTTCATSNCAVGNVGGNPNLPTECQNIATPRIIEISMTNSPFRFDPSNPRIEGESLTSGVPWAFQCIQWHKIDTAAIPWHSATDDTVGSSCNTATNCSSANITPPCDWETGNIDAGLEYSVCHYAKVPPAIYNFRCRLHNAFGMNGSLTVVQPIELLVSKNVSGDVILEWATGGVGPWNVWQDSSASMPVPSNLTPAGTASRSFTDIAPFGNLLFYLVSERN